MCVIHQIRGDVIQVQICFKKCGEWTFLFATNVANVKILLDIAALDTLNLESATQHVNFLNPWAKHSL